MAKTLSLPFARTKKLDPRINFSRASTGGYYGADGLYRVAANNEGRFDHDPATGESKGLLIEEQRTNLLTYSEQFDNAAWGAISGTTVTANTFVAPDGTLTADQLSNTSATSAQVFQGVTILSGATVTGSCYLKSTGASEVQIVLLSNNNTTPYGRATFNIYAGVISASAESLNGGASASAAITSVGNGWYRCSVTVTYPAVTAAGMRIVNVLTTTNSYSIWGAQLEAGAFPTSYVPSNVSFAARSGQGSFIGSNGLIQSAATNVARYNYNPLNLTLAPKLLLEEQRTNLLTYSEQFDNAAWGKFGASVSANVAVAPDGSASADKLVEDTSTGVHQITSSAAVTSATLYTVSVYAKAAGRTQLSISGMGLTGAGYGCYFNLSGDGSVSSAPAGSSITKLADGWYRCTVVFTSTNTTGPIVYLYNGSTLTYTGDGTSGVYIWGAQLEQGAYPTSYIPTTTAQVTRAADVSSSAQATRVADVASITGTNFSSFYNQSEGTFVATSSYTALPAYGRVFQADDGTNSNSITIINTTLGNPRVCAYVVSSGVTQVDTSPSINNAVSGTPFTSAVSYKTNDLAFQFSSNSVVLDTSLSLPVINRMSIGSFGGANPINGHIKQLDYYNTRLPNAELQALTQPTSSYVPATLNLNFAQAKRLDPRVTFNRASTATYYGSNGTLKLAEANQPRFDHDPATYESKGLLIEEQRTNLLTYSEQFDNAAWAKTEASVTANTVVAPDGVTSGDKIIASAISAAHLVAVAVNVTSGTAYTFTFYAKAGEYQFAGLLFAAGGFGTNTVDTFNLSTGSVSLNASGTASIVPVGNGWYRCSATRTASATAASTFQIRVSSDSVGSSYTGDGTSGIYIWGAQLEAGSFPTSYIPTTSAQATRAADVASMTGTNFSSWYNQSEGTLFAEAARSTTPAASTFPMFVSADDGTTNNRVALLTNSARNLRGQIAIGGVFTTIATSVNYTEGYPFKLSIAYKALDQAVSTGGLAVATNTSVGVPVVNRLNIGDQGGTGAAINGHIKRIAYFTKRLANTELQALTS